MRKTRGSTIFREKRNQRRKQENYEKIMKENMILNQNIDIIQKDNDDLKEDMMLKAP